MTDDPAWALAQHVCRMAYTDLPASTVESARRDILDTFGCMLGGSGSPGIGELFAVVSRWGGLAESRVLLCGVSAFLAWSWLHPRSLGRSQWLVRLPSGPLVLVQIVVGLLDLTAAALAMYVLIPFGLDIGLFRLLAVFIAATLLGFASHAPAGLGVFDATILIGLGSGDSEQLLAVLLMFRFLYHLLPLSIALMLFGGVEAWRNLRRKATGADDARSDASPRDVRATGM